MALVGALALPLGGCLLIISTAPTPVSQAQIVVIVRTEGSGQFVAGAGVRIHTSGSGDELGRGITDVDGRFSSSMSIGHDVRSLRVVVEAPPGFVVPASQSRLLEVALSSWDEPLTVRLARER
jgi:hypothetical protein